MCSLFGWIVGGYAAVVGIVLALAGIGGAVSALWRWLNHAKIQAAMDASNARAQAICEKRWQAQTVAYWERLERNGLIRH